MKTGLLYKIARLYYAGGGTIKKRVVNNIGNTNKISRRGSNYQKSSSFNPNNVIKGVAAGTLVGGTGYAALQ